MSEREEIQNRIADHLHEHSWFFDAPYGILTSTVKLPKGGAYRSITFGVSRWLDAEVRIWSPTNIEIRAEGALASMVEGTYESVDEVIDKLSDPNRKERP